MRPAGASICVNLPPCGTEERKVDVRMVEGGRRAVFMQGMHDGVPIALGYFVVSFTLGILAGTAGLSPVQGFVASWLNFASAGEYAGFTSIAAHVPEGLSNEDAAALPLTTLTGWETLFDRLDVQRPVTGAAPALLVIGGAGGVGSITIQLARALTGLTVIATASRPESVDWVKRMGAHHAIDHSRPLAPQVSALGIGAPAFVFCTNGIDRYLPDIVELIAPQGRIAMIDDPETLDIVPLKRKSLTISWEFMFTRSLLGTADIARQGEILRELGDLVSQGKVRSTRTETLGRINAQNLRRAHERLEGGRTLGKLVLAGW